MSKERSTRSKSLPPNRRASRPRRVATRAGKLPRVLTRPHHNLPLALSSFIGREAELASLGQLLATERIVTLTGPGGCGKSRLALEAAHRLVQNYRDGGCWVELAALNDPMLVPQIIASGLDVRDRMSDPIQALVEYLREKKLLLVLDNCEHLVDACARLVYHLAQHCAGLVILATSREAFKIEGERIFPLQSMTIPPPEQWSDPIALPEFEAIRLFVERAHAVAPRFALSAQNALAVAQVCYQLDGIPLAIELAAARVQVLSPEQIGARLDDRFNLLVGGSRIRLPRHQTLRGAIDWSYDLLSEPEQRLLCSTSVFVGGWTIEAADAVCAETRREAQLVLDGLTQLVEKSLVVVQEHGGPARYDMLETIRHYAIEKLAESGQAELIRNRHLAFFLRLAEQAEQHQNGPHQVEWFGRLEREHNNLRAALTWALESAQAESALRLAAACTWFWYTHGYWSEGRLWLKQALAQGGSAAVLARAQALNSAGSLAAFQNDYQEAVRLCDESLALYRELGDERGMSSALFNLAFALTDQKDLPRAQALAQSSLTLRRKIGDKNGVAFSLHLLGEIAREKGEYARALTLHQESLALWQELGNKWAIPLAQSCLGWVARLQGRYQQARPLLEDSIVQWQALGDERGVATSLWQLGAIEHGLGNAVLARSHLQQAVTLLVRVGDRWSLAYCFEWLADLARAGGELERAACLFGAAEGLRQAIAAPLPPGEGVPIEQARKAIAATLGKQAFTAAYTDGRRLSLEQVVAYALESPSQPDNTGRPSPDATSRQIEKAKFAGLTSREREVAVLVTQGKSNRVIADQLVVTERTIEKHVENVMSKLGFTSRTQIVAWVMQKGLASGID